MNGDADAPFSLFSFESGYANQVRHPICSPGKFYLCEVPETSSFSENSSVSRKKKQLDHFFGCCTANS